MSFDRKGTSSKRKYEMADYQKRKRRRKIRKRIIRIILLLFLTAVVLFTVYQLYRAYDSTIITEPALEQTVYDVINVDGFAVRSENIITYSGSGRLAYAVENAQRIEKDGVIAYAYSNDQSVSLKRKKDDIITRITQLESVEHTEGTDPAALDKQIDERLVNTLSIIGTGDTEGLRSETNQLLLLMNKRQVVADESNLIAISDRIAELQKESDRLSGLMGNPLETLYSGQAGYFSVDVDGCENLVDFSTVTKMKPEQFALLPEKIDEEIPAKAIGKVIDDYRWYFVFEIPIERLSQFRVGSSMKVKFSDTETGQVTMDLVSVNSSDSAGKGSALGVLRCTEINEELISLRRETARITLSSHTGLRVSTRAVHYNENNRMGVYTVVGNIATFKRIYPVYTSDNFIICSDPPKKEEEAAEEPQGSLPPADEEEQDDTPYLKKYDEVIVEGKDLRDGKIVKG